MFWVEGRKVSIGSIEPVLSYATITPEIIRAPWRFCVQGSPHVSEYKTHPFEEGTHSGGCES